MSNFFSNLFGGNKSRSKKEKVKEPEVPQHSIQKSEEELSDNVPALNRRLSLSKSGRMKEKKRTNISVMKAGLEGNIKSDVGRKSSLPGKDVFDVEGIEKAAEDVEKV